MEVDSGRNGTGHGQKRTTEEEIPAGGDAKRSREEGGRNTTTACQDYQSMDEDEDNDYYNDDSNFLDSYRTTRATNYGKNDGSSFEDETAIPPMQHTDGRATDIFSQDQCDSSLTLTGPSRAVVLINPVMFEVDLKVITHNNGGLPLSESEEDDKVLSYNAFFYDGVAHMSNTGFARRSVESTEYSTMEFVFAHLIIAVEATIAVRVIEGSTDFRARLTAGIDEDVVLLDSGDGKVAVVNDDDDSGPLVVLQRRVVVVGEKGSLILGVEAAEIGSEEIVTRQVDIRPRHALRSRCGFNLGFCRMSIMIAWSVLP
uniref:DUF6598 domain-containing protein n=1 Tax=Oryza barthii TaxID=65489 RepID=A0A0D3HRY4_9ORYZ